MRTYILQIIELVASRLQKCFEFDLFTVLTVLTFFVTGILNFTQTIYTHTQNTKIFAKYISSKSITSPTAFKIHNLFINMYSMNLVVLLSSRHNFNYG